jgi:hypothetical protein
MILSISIVFFFVVIIAVLFWNIFGDGYKYSDFYQKRQLESNETQLFYNAQRIERIESRLGDIENKVDLLMTHLGLEIPEPLDEGSRREAIIENSLWNRARQNRDYPSE